ncbi:hypothetical protein Tco_0528330 [Tanacetum coccineum]
MLNIPFDKITLKHHESGHHDPDHHVSWRMVVGMVDKGGGARWWWSINDLDPTYDGGHKSYHLSELCWDFDGEFELLGGMGVINDPSWWASPSKVASHFGTSGLVVAAAIGVTHPIGFFFRFSII